MLVRSCLKSCIPGFSITWTKNSQTSKLGLEKAEEPEIKIANICWIIKKAREFQKNIYLFFIDYTKAFVWIITNCGKLLARWEYQTIIPVSWETCMWVKKQQLESHLEQLTGLGSRKEYDRAVCCHPVCLTYTLSTSWEMPGWMS